MQGSYIGIMAENNPSLFAGLLGILKSGNAFVPINPVFPNDRVRFIINDCRIKILLTDNTNYEKARQVVSGSPGLEHLICLDDFVTGTTGQWSENKGANQNPLETCYVIYTSGSTGRPKGVPITHRNLIPLFCWFREYFRLGEHTRVMQNLSYTFDFGVFEIFTTLLFGGSIYTVNKAAVSDFSTYVYFINQHSINTLHTTPVFFNNIANIGQRLSFIKLLHLGGERLTGKMVRNAAAVVPPGCHIYNGYGPTEATINCAIFSIPGEKESDEGATIPIGRPSASNEIYIMDQYNNLQPIGAAGELCVAGTGLARGYLNQPELTIKSFWRSRNLFSKRFLAAGGSMLLHPIARPMRFPTQHTASQTLRGCTCHVPAGGIFYKTGDLARWLPSGNIEFLGRIDHQVKVRGFRIELGEIENCLFRHPGIKEAVVIAREHENGPNYLCAYMVTRHLQSLPVSQLREYLAKELPDYMIPAYFIPMEKIPLTTNGKIDREALPEPDETVFETGIEYAPPVTDTEKKLVAIWQQLLRVEKIGINDDFFEWGGDSILVNRCIARIREELQVEIPLRKFFERPYIKALAERVEKQKQQVSAIKPAKRGEDIPLSYAQERLWFLQELDAENVAYFVPRVIRMKGKLDIDLVERTFTEIIRRHEILRTIFPTVDGRPVQRIHPPYVFKIPVMDWSKEDREGQNQKVFDFLEEEGQQPFGFEHGPLLRVTLLKLEEEEHLFVLTEHHLIHDGWTQGVLLKEFITIFTAYSEGKEHQLPELPIQYADYAIWQREFLKEDVLGRHLDYWSEKLTESEPVLELPTDRPRPSVISGEGALKVFHPSSTFTQELKAFSRKNGVTLFMTMLAVFKTLLYRYTGVEDLCVGTGIANRRYKELEGMLGMVINTLPLRTRTAGDMAFTRCLQRVKETCLEAYQHEDTPFGKIVKKIKPDRNLSYTPIFQVLFSFMDTPTSDLRLPGLTLQVEPTHNRSSKFDINVVVVPPEQDGGETLVEWEYNTDIFNVTTMDRMIAHYTRLLAEVVNTPAKTLSSLSMLSEDETRQLLYTFNDTAAAYPADKTIHRLFEEQVEKTPDRIALVGKAQSAERRAQSKTRHAPCAMRHALSYKKLNEESNKLAALLMEKGLQPGDIAAILGGRSVEMVLGILAILKAGGAYLPIDADYPEERIEYMLADSGAAILLTDLPEERHFNRQLSIVNCQLLMSLPDTPLHHSFFIDHHSGDLAYIIYTSGSTGQPKGVMATHRNVVRLVKNTDYVPLTQETRILQTGAPVFDATTFEIWGSLLNEGQLVLVDKEVILDAHQLRDALTNHQINTLWLSAPLFNRLMQLNIELFTPLRYLLVGGDVLSPPHINRVKQRFPGLEIINGYGPTENTTFSTTHLVEKEYEGSIPIGRPIANSTAYIYDKNNQLVPVGVWGELVVGGDGVSQGYLNSPEMTAERFNRSYIFYKTGDLARWLPGGTIEFKGRLDQQVKIRGFRIELGEIENQLLKHEQIKEAVVIDRKDQGEKFLCAYIVSPSDPAPGAVELKTYLSKHFPAYMIPSFFIPLGKIPLNPNGKVDRRRLPSPRSGQGHRESGPYTAPRDGIERTMADIWADVLNINKIGIDDNFFDMGGHSLNAAVLVARMHKTFHAKMPLMEFFKRGCIREVAQYIKEAGKETFTVIEPVEEREYYPLSSAQKRLYVLHQMEKDSIGYNIPAIMVLEGILDGNHLGNVFVKLIERHESLRTSFTTINEDPVQKIHGNVEFKVRYFTPPPRISFFIRPFDLSRAPLMRVGLVKVEEEKHILMVDMHHIITDGTSMGVLVKEFTALYAGTALSPLKLHYKDYAQWQRQRESGALETQATYWQEQFRAEIPVLELPTDFARPAVQCFEGRRLDFEITPQQAKQLRNLAKHANVTLFMALLAAYHIFLSKISGQETIVIGTAVAGRRHADLEPIIGMFVNTLGLKNQMETQKTFDLFLQEINNRTLEAFENQDYPFEELVEEVAVTRDAGRNPLFDVMFVQQNIDIPEVEIPGLKLRPYKYETGISKFDLMLQAIERGENIGFTFEYSTSLFKEETLRRFVGYFKKVVSAITRQPSIKIAGIEIISEAERQQLLIDFNDTAAEYPGDKSINRLFEEEVKKRPGKAAVVYEGEVLTYTELNRQADELAARLQWQEVVPGMPVGIKASASLEMIIGILGILKAGGAYLPIETDFPRERIEYMLADSGAGILLTDLPEERHFNCKLSIVNCQLLMSLPNSPLHHSSFIDHHPGDLAYIIYTSGSTGKPKGVMVEHGSVVRLVKNTNYITFKEDDRILQTCALVFDVSTFEIWGSLLNGLTLYLADKYKILNASTLKKIITGNRINIMWLTAPLFNQLVQADVEVFAGLETLLAGGDVLSPPHINKVKQRFPGLRVINGYGPTENTTFSTTYLIEKEFEQHIPIGRPIANSTAYIVDKTGHLQPIGIAGELWVGGDGVARGYLNNPELTNSKFQAPAGHPIRIPNSPLRFFASQLLSFSLYRTGDLARWLQDPAARGAYIIEFLGRIDQQVKIRGFRIELSEIENQLLKHERIKEAVVIDRKDGEEKYLCAYVVPHGTHRAWSMEHGEGRPALKEFLSQTLPDYMIPSFFIPLEKMPLNPSGKLDRHALPGPAIQKGERYTPPGDALERGLVKLWAEVLDIEENLIGIDANFFELGGHSLKATTLLSKIHQAFHAAVPLGEVFKTPTVRGVARYIKGKTQSLCTGIEAVEKKEYYALSSAQKRLYVLQQIEPDSTAYNMPAPMEVEGELHKEKFEESFKKLVARHESLRTSFELIDGEPVQRIHKQVVFECSMPHAGTLKNFIRPFDLSKAPLLRVGLTNIEERKHLLIIDMHHIITDALSQGLLLKDLLTFYSGQFLSPLKLQYKDYSEWQNSEARIKQIKQQETYWLGQFARTLPLLDLPGDYPRPPVQNFEGGTVRFKIAREMTDALKTVALEQGVTLQMLMMAVFHILLSKPGGQEDIITGTTAAGRGHADLGNIFGLFVNILALRTFPAGGKTFREYLEEVKRISLDAYENQDYPFETLAKKLADQRDTSRNPLFDIAFEIQVYEAAEGDITKSKYEIPGLALIPCDMEMNTTKFDQDWIGRETEEGMRFSVLYCTKLFKPETIELMVERYLFLIEDILADQGSPIEDLECRTPFEKELNQVKEVAFNF